MDILIYLHDLRKLLNHNRGQEFNLGYVNIFCKKIIEISNPEFKLVFDLMKWQ